MMYYIIPIIDASSLLSPLKQLNCYALLPCHFIAILIFISLFPTHATRYLKLEDKCGIINRHVLHYEANNSCRNDSKPEGTMPHIDGSLKNIVFQYVDDLFKRLVGLNARFLDLCLFIVAKSFSPCH